jgi:hypothetical protein
MNGRNPSTFQRTRSPSANNSDVYTPNTSSSTSTTASQTESRFYDEDEAQMAASYGIRLPSFQELDAQTVRAPSPLRQRPQNRPSASTATNITGAQNPMGEMEVIDLSGEPGDPPIHQFTSPYHAPASLLQPRIPHRNFFGHAERGPRFPGAEIIDLTEDSPQHSRGQAQGGDNDDAAQNIGSPEIQFLRARQLSPRLRFAGATPPAGRVPAPNRLNPAGRAVPIDLNDDDDDIQIIGERRITPPPVPRGGGLAQYFVNYGAGVGTTAARFLVDAGLISGRPNGGFSNRAPRRPIHPGVEAAMRNRLHGFEIPNLDFGMAAFDLGYGVEAEERTEREESVVQAPEAAPEGFTRNPVEEDVLICPNCDAELSVGDNEVKRQVWLVKGCGHVSLHFTFLFLTA